ncbi:hypothetical protein [Enterobacter hormaechei]|uniref:hypothetical protein n=1 Tax=Enterobacter hormaechei TaxID=158836 RepID=UPI002E2B10CF|nr:hypothetical protein [Enterobacter hormaechei]MED5745117.1 hypothetical protein [Enterobacter hormaechei]
MECNVSELVKRGHDQVAELKSSCGAVDVRDVAQLISDLATQLDVQLARSNALAAENAGLKAAHPQPFGPVMMKALDAYEKHQDETPETGMLDAFFILRDSIRADTTATDAFLAEVRAQGVEMFAAHKRERQQALRSRSMRMSEEAAGMAADAENFADELRKGVQS